MRDCRDCAPGRYCEHHRRLARKYNAKRRPMRQRACFRCLNAHPQSERYCPLAAEYEGPFTVEAEA